MWPSCPFFNLNIDVGPRARSRTEVPGLVEQRAWFATGSFHFCLWPIKMEEGELLSRVGSQLPTGQPAKADSRPSEEALLVRAQKTQRPVFTLDIIDLYLIRPSFSCLTVLRQDQPNINVETETYTHIERERKKRQREPPHTHAHAHTRTHTLR